MERAEDKRLQELRDSGETVYSISRLDTINNCMYEAYRTYVLGDRGKNNIYALLGGKVHDVLEGITNSENTEADLLPAMKQELEDMDMLGIKFPNDTIRSSWETDMTHFCTTYKAPQGDFKAEQLFIYKTPKGKYLQGYIDLTRYNKDGSISIYDYKTSSMYTGEAIKEHGRQLTVYALGMIQAGYEVKEVAWLMLKYCTIKFMGKKTVKSKEKTQLEKVVERRKIATEMTKYVEQDLFAAGYDEVDIEIYLNDFKNSNSFDVLPEEIRNNYKIIPYVMKYTITDDVIKECEEYIDNTIEMWEKLDSTDLKNYPPRKFTKLQKNGKEVDDYFFCVNLCGHSSNCPYLQEFLAKKDTQTNNPDDDLF